MELPAWLVVMVMVVGENAYVVVVEAFDGGAQSGGH